MFFFAFLWFSWDLLWVSLSDVLNRYSYESSSTVRDPLNIFLTGFEGLVTSKAMIGFTFISEITTSAFAGDFCILFTEEPPCIRLQVSFAYGFAVAGLFIMAILLYAAVPDMMSQGELSDWGETAVCTVAPFIGKVATSILAKFAGAGGTLSHTESEKDIECRGIVAHHIISELLSKILAYRCRSFLPMAMSFGHWNATGRILGKCQWKIQYKNLEMMHPIRGSEGPRNTSKS